MNTDDHVMTILERANPVPPDDVPDVAIGAARYLDDLQQRSSTVTIRSTESPTTRRRWAMLGAAAAVVLVLVAAVYVVGGDDDSVVVDTPETIPTTVLTTVAATTVAPTTALTTDEPATAAQADPDAAQAVVDDLFAAYNAGDTDVVLAILADDVIVTESYGGSPQPLVHDPDDPYPVEENLAWYIAQAGVWTEPTCGPGAEQRSTGTTLRCSWGSMQAAERAVGADPVPTNAIVVVDEGEIVELHLGYGPNDFATLGIKFSEWLETYHPDVEGAGCCQGDTREESEQRGRLRAQWVQEWAVFLDTYGCSPTGGCFMPLDDWVAEYDGQCVQGESPAVAAELLDHMSAYPPPSPLFFSGEQLLEADEALLEPDLPTDRIAELQQQRLDAMVELGIDERCHPSVG